MRNVNEVKKEEKSVFIKNNQPEHPKIESIEEYFRRKNNPNQLIFQEKSEEEKSEKEKIIREIEYFEYQELQRENARLKQRNQAVRTRLKVIKAREKRRKEILRRCTIAILSITATFGSFKLVETSKSRIEKWQKEQEFKEISLDARNTIEAYTSPASTPDSSNYQWQYSATGIGNVINNKFAQSEQEGKMFLAALDMNLLPYEKWNMDEFIKNTDNNYVNSSDTFLEYVQTLGFANIEEYKAQMIQENHQALQEEKGVSR